MCSARALLTSLGAAILGYQLLLPPVVALADNGDFPKIIGRFGLAPRVHRVYEFASTAYEFHPDQVWNSRFYSSEIPLARAAVFLNSLLSKDGTFDLRLIGTVHASLLVLAIWLIAPLARWWTSAALLVFCDAMYASGLNSFYMDEAGLLFLLLTAVLFVRVLHTGAPREAGMMVACAVLAAASKPQHAALGFILAGLFFVCRRELFPKRRTLYLCGVAALPLASAMMLWKGAPADYAANALYDVIFCQIVPHSHNPSGALRALGLDDSYLPLMGKNAYWSDSRMQDPGFEREFRRRTGFGRLAVFYATHPRDSWVALRDSLDEAGRQSDSGNFDPAAGYAPRAESRAFGVWSRFKRRLFFHHGSRMLAAFLASAALLLAVAGLRRGALPHGALAGAFALVFMACLELAIASLGDAMDIARHHTVFFALWDAMLFAALAMIGKWWRRWRRERLPLRLFRSRRGARDCQLEFVFGSRHWGPRPAAD